MNLKEVVVMQLYAIRYGEQFKYGTKGTVYKNAEQPGEVISDFPFLYYLAELEGKWILIDTGFREEALAISVGVTLLPIESELAEVFGGMPIISQIILTHSHWDHVNNLDLYPGVPVTMSKATYDLILREGAEHVKESLEGRQLHLMEQEVVIADKFTLQLMGGHTPDSCVVYFEEAGKKYVITGDECYTCDNVYQNIPIGISHDGDKNEAFIADTRERGLIPLPFHDAEILKKYPRVSENIVRII